MADRLNIQDANTKYKTWTIHTYKKTNTTYLKHKHHLDKTQTKLKKKQTANIHDIRTAYIHKTQNYMNIIQTLHICKTNTT